MQLYSQSESRQANVTVVGLGASEHGDRSGAVRIVLRLHIGSKGKSGGGGQSP